MDMDIGHGHGHRAWTWTSDKDEKLQWNLYWCANCDIEETFFKKYFVREDGLPVLL
jgi:hypothetical protein